MFMSFDPAILVIGVYSKEKSNTGSALCLEMFIETLLKVVKNWN